MSEKLAGILGGAASATLIPVFPVFERLPTTLDQHAQTAKDATKGVRVNATCPGFFPAEQNRKILDKTRIANILGQTPMARFGEPEELVGAAILLASRKGGSFITGAAYYVDGGFTAMRF